MMIIRIKTHYVEAVREILTEIVDMALPAELVAHNVAGAIIVAQETDEKVRDWHLWIADAISIGLIWGGEIERDAD